MSIFIIPVIVLFIVFYGFISGINIYDSFIRGVKEGLLLIFDIFPVIFCFVISVNILVNSNIINDFFLLLKSLFKIPSELFTLAILRPISGSSSLIILNNILRQYGTNSYWGRVASVIQGSTDTTIYIIGLYFSVVGVKKIRYALIVGLLSDLVAIILAFVVINILF